MIYDVCQDPYDMSQRLDYSSRLITITYRLRSPQMCHGSARVVRSRIFAG